ncbi:RNA polymerase sigma factor [Chloroflexota bacterium]
MQEEESLVRQARQGDQQAFAQLYEENFDKIYRYVALKIGEGVIEAYYWWQIMSS